MTFIAESDDGVVAPEEATTDEELSCVECAESLGIVSAYRREDDAFVSRHFRHPPSETCGGGESDTHKAMKSIALSKLKEEFPQHAKATLEQSIGDREADAYLRFSQPHETLGYGVIAEAQYRHDDKDLQAVTQEYLDLGYSVYWVYEEDFEDLDVALGDPVRVWPNGGPEYHSREIAEIQTPTIPFSEGEDPVLYTAGAMDAASQDAKWRRAIEIEVENAEFAHPEDTALYHGVGSVGGCVAEDMALLNDADGVVAYLSDPTQNGTLTEILHAVHTNKPTLTVVDPALFNHRYADDDDHHDGTIPHKFEKDDNSWVDAGDAYWFTINYLAGDKPDQRINGDGPDHSVIPMWSGVAGADVWVAGEDDIPGLVQRWVGEQQLPSETERKHIDANGSFRERGFE